MRRRIPGSAIAPIVLMQIALLPLQASSQEKAGEPPADSTLAALHGRVIVSKKEDTRQALMRDQMFGMYSMHGSAEASILIHPPGAAQGRLSERAVIYIESDELGRGTYPVPGESPSLDQKNLQFHPEVLAVLVGTRVEFPNRDNLFHNVFSYSQAKEFDLGRYPKDDSRSVIFDRPGIVRVYCDIHSHMSATIIVLKHPYFTSPDDAGTYSLPRIPPGKYRVVFWCDRDVVERKTVELRAGENLQLDFTD